MPFAPAREIFGSLRFRLTLWNTLVVLLMVVITLFGVRTALWVSLLHEIEQLLVDDLTEMRLGIESRWPDLNSISAELELKAITHKHRGLYVKLIDPTGKLLFQTSTSPKVLVVPHSEVEPFAPKTFGTTRLAQQRIERPGMPRLLVRAGTTLEVIHRELDELTQQLLSVAAVLLIAAPLGGYVLAHRATQPIREIIDTTNQLHPGDLEQRRLPIRGTRDELDRLSSTVNGFLDRIAAFINQSRRFTADAAHELRSPLTAIQSSLEVAMNSDRTVEEYKEVINGVLDECDRLRNLVNQLLMLAEVDREHYGPEAEVIALDETVRKSCEIFQAVAESKGVSQSCDLERARIHGDARRLRQVINNLLDNAIKFTPAGGSVFVELRERAETKDVMLRVADTGPGIDDLDVPFIFDRFYRGDRARQRTTGHMTPGTGLGLSIVQTTVTNHGGKIQVDSQRGRGTTFTIVFPSAGAAGESVGADGAALSHRSGFA